MTDDTLDRDIVAAEPTVDAFERDWVRARAANALFGPHSETLPSVGRFELGDRLGAGGMGVVYAARDPEIDREVAIKLIRVSAADERDATHVEAQRIARVSHPNVVAVHDVGILDDQVYIVMEFVRGATLRAFAREEGRTRGEIVDVYRQACAGLAAAHREGLVHRDFKPDNALVGDDGRVRVIDFGLALDDDAQRPAAGTPKYMAPEQARGEPVTAAADQYSVCASLREALGAESERALPAWLEAITRRGQSELPPDRFPDLEALSAALARDPGTVWRRRAVFVGATVAVTAIAAAFAVGATQFGAKTAFDHCAGGQAIAGAWIDRAAAIARISAMGDYGAMIAPRLAGLSEEFATQWARVHRDACLAGARGEISAELLDRQMVCLDRQRQAYAATGELVADAKLTSVADLVVVFRSLPSPSSCGDLERVSAIEPPPAAVATAVSDITRRLEAAKVAHAAGQFDVTARIAAQLVTEAEALGYKPTLAEARLLEGRAALSLWDLKAAIPPLLDATVLAVSVGADTVAIEAWARRAWAKGMHQEADALAGLELIEALTTRIGRDTFESALLQICIGSVQIARGDQAGAAKTLRAAVDIASRVKGPGELELTNALGNLATATMDDRERDRLAAEQVAILTALVGSEHPQTLEAVLTRANLTIDAVLGLDLLRPACARLRQLHPAIDEIIASCYSELAWFEEMIGNRAEAAEAMATAAAQRTRRQAVPTAMAKLWAGEHQLAARELEQILADQPLAADASWWPTLSTAEIEAALGLAYHSLGDARGRRLLRSALERLEAIDSPLPLPKVRRRIATIKRWLVE